MYVSRVPSLVDKYAQTNSQGFRPRWQYRGNWFKQRRHLEMKEASEKTGNGPCWLHGWQNKKREVILRGWQPGCRRPRWQMRGQSVSKRSFPLGPRLGIVYCTCKMWAHCMSRLHYVAFVQRIRIHRDSTYCTHMGAQTAHIWMQSKRCTHVYAHTPHICMHRMNTCVCKHTPHRLHVCLTNFVIPLADTDFYAGAFLWTLDPAQCSPQKSFSTHSCVMRCCGHWHKCVHSMHTLCPYTAYNVCAYIE